MLLYLLSLYLKLPVYLLGNVNYFVVKSPNSIHYTLWTSKIGENQIGTDTRVIQQPNLGSLFLSQDGGLWTEDQDTGYQVYTQQSKLPTNQLSNVRLNNIPMVLSILQIQFKLVS